MPRSIRESLESQPLSGLVLVTLNTISFADRIKPSARSTPALYDPNPSSFPGVIKLPEGTPKPGKELVVLTTEPVKEVAFILTAAAPLLCIKKVLPPLVSESNVKVTVVVLVLSTVT